MSEAHLTVPESATPVSAKRAREEDAEVTVPLLGKELQDGSSPAQSEAAAVAKRARVEGDAADASPAVGSEEPARESVSLNEDEPLLRDNPNRFVLFPIRFPDIWQRYKHAESAIWTMEEIDLETT